MKNAISGRPSESKIENWWIGIASSAAPPTPITTRTTLIVNSEITSSTGRSGETKRWPRWRDHISSMNSSETESWVRNSTSQSSTAERNSPAASARRSL